MPNPIKLDTLVGECVRKYGHTAEYARRTLDILRVMLEPVDGVSIKQDAIDHDVALDLLNCYAANHRRTGD